MSETTDPAHTRDQEALPQLTPRSWLSGRWLLFLPSVALGLLVVTLVGLVLMVNWYERVTTQAEFEREVQWVESAVVRRMLADQEFVDRIAGAVGEVAKVSAAANKDTDTFLSNSPSVTSFAWNNVEGEPLWLRPLSRPLDQMIAEQPGIDERQRVARLVAATNRATYTVPYRNDAGGVFIQYHSPVFKEGVFQGTVSATYPLSAIMRNMIPEAFGAKAHFEFVDGEGRVIYAPSSQSITDISQSYTVALAVPWRDLKLRATPYRTVTSWLRNLLLAGLGLLLLFLIVALISLQRHIRKRLEADLALQTSYERFLTILDSMDVAVWVANLDNDRLLFMNEACRKRFPNGRLGLSVNRLEKVFEVPPSAAYPRELLLANMENASGFKDEVQEPLSGRWNLLRVKAIRWVDGTIVRLCTVGDITDFKMAVKRNEDQQQKLMQTARLLTMGEMASTLAHEINQPLGAIANYVKGCIRRLKSGQWQEDDLVSAMEKASFQAERAGAVIHRVREFVRDREPNRQRFSINHLLTDALRLTEIESERADVAMQLALSADDPIVQSDRVMIEQVVLNLVKNGIEAMAETPLELRQLTLTSYVDGSNVEVRISDTGKGISEEAAAQLFTAFFTTKPHGMGIGLNICRSIIEMHDGRLWFENNRSPASRGATFLFTLPLAQEPVEESSTRLPQNESIDSATAHATTHTH
jgi:two-component system, LuxR family, sensor histidine kinase DctS